MKFGFDWPSAFGEEDLWKWQTDGRWTTDGQTDERPWLYYKLTNEPKGSGELKSGDIIFSIISILETIYALNGE